MYAPLVSRLVGWQNSSNVSAMDIADFCLDSLVREARSSPTRDMNINTGKIFNRYFTKINFMTVVFRNIERRDAPERRDDAFVPRAVNIASDKKPFVGHKTLPLLCRWPGYSWRRMNLPEIMHGASLLFSNRQL